MRGPPQPKFTRPEHREALLALLRSGEPYATESEISRDTVVTRYYRPDEEFALAEVTFEKPMGVMVRYGERIAYGDESAQRELESMGGPENLIESH